MIRKIILALPLAAAMSGPASAGPQPYIGEIATYAFNFCPRNWLPTDGRLIGIYSNTALYSLIGNYYGGDGKQTFALPNIAPIATQNGPKMLRCIAVYGAFPSRP